MMQKEITRIIDQLNRMHKGESWLGSSMMEILSGIHEEMANTPVPFFNNTIHQIVAHVLATEFVVAQRLAGIDYILTAEEDWKPREQLLGVWEETLQKIEPGKKAIVDKLAKFSDENLDHSIIKDYSSIYVTLHGHLQHTAYHYGQIAMMKRILVSSPKKHE